MPKKPIIGTDVTHQVSYSINFEHRMIEIAESCNKTMQGTILELKSYKVVDINKIANFEDELKYLQDFLTKRLGEQKSNGTDPDIESEIEELKKSISDTEAGLRSVHLVYYWVAYKNRKNGKGNLKWLFKDYICCLYIDGRSCAANVHPSWYFMKPLKGDINDERQEVVRKMSGIFELNHYKIEPKEVLALMLTHAPANRSKFN